MIYLRRNSLFMRVRSQRASWGCYRVWAPEKLLGNRESCGNEPSPCLRIPSTRFLVFIVSLCLFFHSASAACSVLNQGTLGGPCKPLTSDRLSLSLFQRKRTNTRCSSTPIFISYSHLQSVIIGFVASACKTSKDFSTHKKWKYKMLFVTSVVPANMPYFLLSSHNYIKKRKLPSFRQN